MRNKFYKMKEAVQAVVDITNGWKFKDSDEKYSINELINFAEQSDKTITVEEDMYYMISSKGAIGFTDDRGENVEWLFIPLKNDYVKFKY